VKVSEINSATEKYSAEDLKKLVKELYKCIPKKVRDDKEIDDLITNMDKFLADKKAKKIKSQHPDFPDLKAEIDKFVDDAQQQYYFAPNRYISKKQRPKWRFMVKRFVKQLESIPVNDKNGHEATELLRDLYNLLCVASMQYLFNTENPFASVGITQQAFYEKLIKRLLLQGKDRAVIDDILDILFENEVNYDESKTELMYVLIENLKTVDMKERTIEQTHKRQPKVLSQKPLVGSHYDYFKQMQTVNMYTTFILVVDFSLSEYEKGIAYFKKYYQSEVEEQKVETLLDWLQTYNLKDEWLTEYEYGLKAGVKLNGIYPKQYNILKEDKDAGFEDVYNLEFEQLDEEEKMFWDALNELDD
jgi:hypothetical protein